MAMAIVPSLKGIPIEMARRHGLEKPSHVVVEERQEGILIKKLEL